jgi:tetratricopeptide (TPR) repeat protein
MIITGFLGLVVGAAMMMAQEAPPAQQPAPAPQAAPANVAKQPQPKSKEEVEALQAMFAAQDPDTRIQAADTLLAKFADTEFKSIALFFAAASYEQKGDFEKTIIYAERTLEADPGNYNAMLMLARNIAQRTKEHDLDREEKLGKVTKFAKSAEDALKTAPKPNPQLTDEQWTAAKKDLTAQAHEALGLAAMARKKYDVAITEFKTAIDDAANPDPATMVRLGAVYNLSGKHDEAIAVLDKVMAAADAHPQIKQFAQAERARAVQAKSGAGKPAGQPAAPAPPQVEIKKP